MTVYYCGFGGRKTKF